MDPVTAIGLAASVVQVAATGVTVVHTLDTFRRTYAAAPDSINALNTETACISASISHLKELFDRKDNNLVNVLREKPELSKALSVCLVGCNNVLLSLEKDMRKIHQSEGGGENKMSLKRRASFLWKQDIFKTYLDQIHGHQNALNLLLQALQMHSLGEIESLLRKEKTRAILEEMSQDQTTLRGSPSITYLDMSDTEPDLEMKMVEAKLPRGALDNSSGTNAPSIYAGDEDLIDFSGPQIMDNVVEEQVSPALEQMKMLDPQFDAMTMKRGTVPTVHSAEKEREKHDSMQSTTNRPNVLVLHDPWASSRRASQVSDSLSPLSPVSSEAMSIIAVDRSASVTSSCAGSSGTVASVESEFPEVVRPDESVDPFPSVIDPPSFLPISWQEEEAALEAKRLEVLRSGNVDDQLDFAESALHFCAIVKNHHTRISRTQKVATEETDMQRMLKADAKPYVLRHVPYRHAKALFLQSMYFDLDQVTSCELQKVALANGYYRAAFYLGNMLEISKATKRALGYYNEGADGGDSACQCRLADIYLKGDLGKKKDHEKAIKYLRRAAACADRDYPQALFLLATLQTESYRKVNKIRESILPTDESAARENFRKAALLGCPNSQMTLGHAYSSARLGCPKNPAIALHYFRLAARQGVPAADHEISTWFGFAKEGDLVSPNPRLAYQHARRAAEDEYLPSIWQVGHFHQKGVGVKVDPQKARIWYMKGAAKGDKSCAAALDHLRKRGYGIHS